MVLSALGRVRNVGLLNASACPIAVDFGVGSLKVLQITNTDPSGLIAAAALETPLELVGDHAKRLAFQAQQLPRLIKGMAFKGKRAVCSIPASQMFCKHMQFAKTDGVSLETLVQTAVPQQLEVPENSLLLRHVEVAGATSPATGRTEVICLAAARELVSRLMASLRACKLEVVGIHPECLATIRAFKPASEKDEKPDRTTLYLDIGAGTTKAMIAHGSELVFAKTILVGGRHLDEAIARRHNASVDWAHESRLSAESLVPTETAPSAEFERKTPIDLSEQLETLTDEVAMCLRYHESLFPGRRVDRAILVGGECRHKPFAEHVARALRLPTHIADPMARVARSGTEPARNVDMNAPQPGWTVPFGLSLCPTDL